MVFRDGEEGVYHRPGRNTLVQFSQLISSFIFDTVSIELIWLEHSTGTWKVIWS